MTIPANEFLTHNYYQKNPKEIWLWHKDFQEMAEQYSPNEGHIAIAEMQCFFQENDINSTIITQVNLKKKIKSFFKINF